MDFVADDDYITLLLNRLGRRSDTTLQGSVIDELRQAQRQLENGRFLPWFLLTRDNTTPVYAGTQAYSSGSWDWFIRECDEAPPVLIDAEGNRVKLIKGVHSVLADKYANASQGTPKYYSLLKQTIYLWPTPAENYTFEFWFYQRQREIAIGGIVATNAWLVNASDWLLNVAGEAVAAFHLQKADMAQRFARAASIARDNVMTLHEAREHTNMNYSDDSEYETGT